MELRSAEQRLKEVRTALTDAQGQGDPSKKMAPAHQWAQSGDARGGELFAVTSSRLCETDRGTAAGARRGYSEDDGTRTTAADDRGRAG